MSPNPLSSAAACFSRRATILLAFFLTGLLATAPSVRGQMIDLNHNGVSDVWEWLYNAYGINPAGDPDGDAFSNLQEATAGTDPFDPASHPQITSAVCSNGVIAITFPIAPGKRYELQSVSALPGTNWISETNAVARSGINLTLTVPVGPAMKLYRVGVSDVDTAGSGMNDWEKYQLGLDPFNPYSNGQQDANGNPLSDYSYATNLLASQDQISLSAALPAATQPAPGQGGGANGAITISRGGFPLTSLIVVLASGPSGPGWAAPGIDYEDLSGLWVLPAGTASMTIPVQPLSNTNLAAPALAQFSLVPSTAYSLGASTNATVVVYPSAAGPGVGLVGWYYTNASTTYTNSKNFNPTNLVLTRLDPVVDFNWTNGTVPNLSNDWYSVRWTGQVQPQFSETYVFDVKSDDGCRLWVNDQLLIDQWRTQGLTEMTGSLPLQAGTRYDLRLEYLQTGGAAQIHLAWYSPSQPEQMIPAATLYPTNSTAAGGSNAPPAVTSPLTAVAFVGQPFSFTVTAANTPFRFAARGLPPGLTLNPTNGLITGIPTLAGNFQVALTASNRVGTAASVLAVTVLNPGGGVVRELWTNVPGVAVSAIPTVTPANLTNTLAGLQGATGFGQNYGERIRGYFTAPATANYYFWAAGSDSVQLWISDDGDPVNKVLRASVYPTNNPAFPGVNGTRPLQWNAQAAQQSGWLALTAGQRYYLEVLHKAGTGTNDNWAVGWLQDPTGTNTSPAGLIPGYLVSRYYPPLPAQIPGTLYSANLLALPGVVSDGVGSATLRLSADQTRATLAFTFTNLVGTPSAKAIMSDAYLTDPPELVFDISAALPQADGTYVWPIAGAGPLAAADVLEIIREGKASIVIASSAFGNGEIGGHFTLADGSQTFTPPPPPAGWVDDSANPNAAVRFLAQATFGGSPADIAAVQAQGYSAWLAGQFGAGASHLLPEVMAKVNPDPTDPYPSSLFFNAWWHKAVTAPDQLRQRVAFALSEVFVVSEDSGLVNHSDMLASYYDMLVDHAFGNYRPLLEAVTLHPAMGNFLDMRGNNKGSMITGLHPDENYAREVQQLFSIGLNRLWPDGSLVLNSQGNLVPTYGQGEIQGFAAVFTGWNYYQPTQANGLLPSNWYPAYNGTNPMVLVPAHHDPGAKTVLDNVALPPAWGGQLYATNPANGAYGTHDLEAALDSIFNHPNVGPFICRELIQRLVTSNPSRDYLYRVVQVFNDDGTGVRGNLQAVIQAILLDYEARSPQMVNQPGYGKQREPLLRVTHLARAFAPPAPVTGLYSQTTNQVITISTAVPHHLASRDTVFLTFTDTSGQPAPASQAYVVAVVGPQVFTVTAPQLLTGPYGQTNGTITLTLAGNGLAAGDPVYLNFMSGGAVSGLYQVATVADTAHFTVGTTDLVLRSGSALLTKTASAGYTQTGTNLVISVNGPHNLAIGEHVFIHFGAGTAADGVYPVAAVPDATHFTVFTTNSANQVQNSVAVYPLQPPPLNRAGTVSVGEGTWNMGYTDTGTAVNLSQSPLRSPTVFNFFYPGYRFPGALASAGLTTPEFQLTTASGVTAQMNFIEGGLFSPAANTNGLTSFTGGSGAVVLDLSPWMTTNLTANAGVPSLVSNLNNLLAAGQLSAAAQTNIAGYVGHTTNFPWSAIPTDTQMRDRVRAVAHLIINAPDYIIQK